MAKNPDTLNPEEKAKFWEDHIQAWQKTDLSQSEYCRKNRLVPHRFWYWRKRIEQPSAKGITFVPLPISPNRTGQTAPVTSITTPNGYRIEFTDGFNPAVVRQLMYTIRDM